MVNDTKSVNNQFDLLHFIVFHSFTFSIRFIITFVMCISFFFDTGVVISIIVIIETDDMIFQFYIFKTAPLIKKY